MAALVWAGCRQVPLRVPEIWAAHKVATTGFQCPQPTSQRQTGYSRLKIGEKVHISYIIPLHPPIPLTKTIP